MTGMNLRSIAMNGALACPEFPGDFQQTQEKNLKSGHDEFHSMQDYKILTLQHIVNSGDTTNT
jgi:hypothetical protein